jgi:hypothetical protein
MTRTKNSYPPLNVLKAVAERVWIVDAPPIRAAGLPLPVRMTVIQLASGELLLHSPTRYDEGLARELARIGPVRHLVAPSFAHWMFLKDWQEANPVALTWAAPGLRKRRQLRRAGVRIDEELLEKAPPDWSGEIEQVLVRSGPFAEVELFHRPSRTLLLTDIVQNLEPERLPAAWRGPTQMLGVTAPSGKAPAYLRLLLRMNGRKNAEAATRLLNFRPQRVVFAHGRWFDENATDQLAAALAWMTRGPGRRPSARTVGVGLAVAGAVGAGLAAAVFAARSGRRSRGART